MAKKVTKKTPTKKTATKKKTAPKKTATRKRVAAKKPTKTVAAAPVSVSEEQVRVRAYEIFCSGRNASNPDADWIQAEQELTAELSA